MKRLAVTALLVALSPAPQSLHADGPKSSVDRSWVEPMQKVHARFTGTKGTFACFGDSIAMIAYGDVIRIVLRTK